MSTRNLRNRWLVLALGILALSGLASTTATAAAPVNRVELVMDARGFSGPVTGLTFSSDGTMLAASGQREVRIWDLRTGRLLRVVRGEIGEGGFGDALAVAFSHDNCELVLGTREEDGRGVLRTYDLRNMAAMKDRVDDLPAAVEQLAFSRDGRHLIAVCAGGAIVAYDWRLRRVIGTREAQPGAAPTTIRFPLADPLLLDLAADSATVLSVPGLAPVPIDRRIPQPLVRWLENRSKLEIPLGGRFTTFDLRLDQDKWLGAGLRTSEGSSKHWVGLWAGELTTPVLTYDKHRSAITAVALNWAGALAASADRSGEIHVWDAETGQARYVFRSVGRPIYRAALDIQTGRIGFTTEPVQHGWDRNNYGRIDRVFDLGQRMILNTAAGDFPGETTGRDGRLSLTYTGGQFGLRLTPDRGRRLDFSLPDGVVPTTYTLLRLPQAGSEFPVVVGDQDGRMLLIDPVQGQIRREIQAHQSFITSLSESADGRFLTTSSTDRTIRLWSLPNLLQSTDVIQPLLTLFLVNEGDWILWTPQGYYDASPGSGDLVGWHVNYGVDQVAGFYPLHQFRAQLYRPDLVNDIFQRGSLEGAIAQATSPELPPAQPIDAGMAPPQPIGQESVAAQPPAQTLAMVQPISSPVPLTTDFRKPETMQNLEPPRVRLLSPRDGMTTREGQIHLLAQVVSPNSMPITEVKVLVNGRPVSGKGVSVVAAEDAERKEASFSRAVGLLPGENEIAVLARNEVAASSPIMVRVFYEAPAKVLKARPNLHLLSIGISDYKDPNLSLRYADRDARAFAELWLSQVGPVYENIHKTLLLNEEATADRVREALRNLGESVRQRDMAVIFISAHGIRNRQLEYYLATHEIDPENPDKTGLHFSVFSQMLEKLPCKVLLFVDTCHAAGITGAKAIMRDPLYELTSDEYGTIVFSSSLSREISREDEKWEHGAFTKAILDTFAAKDTDLNGDGFLSLTEMEQSVCDRVQQMTEGEQHPVMKRPATIHNIPFYYVGERDRSGEPTLAPKT